MRLSLLSFLAIPFTFITFCVAGVSEIKPVKAASFSVVAEGLDNVRGLSFGPDGSLYITEAGVGGNQLCTPSLKESVPNQFDCIGTSGAITRIKDGKQERVLTGLPSQALSPIGAQGVGASDIQFDRSGNPYLLIGFASNVNYNNTPLNSPNWGQLYKVDFNTGTLTSIADISSYKLVTNPNGIFPNGDLASNPYTFTIQGDTAYIADAAGDDVLSVKLDGSNLTTVTTLPGQTITNPILPSPEASPAPIPQEIQVASVPTGVAIGPDQALYVSQLTGFPSPEGKASIFRIEPDGKATVYADGFTQLTDLSFDSKGNLYALQFANQPFYNKGNFDGSLIQIAPDGTRTTLLSGNGLESATALTIGPDGAIYVSTKGDRAGVGQVLRVDNSAKVPEPSSAIAVIALGVGVGSFLKRKRCG
ncbi:ScyD/ScyE family protein [Tolypothrix sp. VBCCA 56010]|uniref:ScyD/ScyE family protein n=1 Tax=Tolypothrix sp. VBCCA 56010 TaxID=3137731 RepID=UPI003D7D2776